MDSFIKLANNGNKNDTTNQSYIQQAQHLWSMLDDMANNNPDSYKKFIEKTLKDGKDAMKEPEAHMCIRTMQLEPKNCNLFINIFSWHKIPAPETDEHPIPVFGREIEYINNISRINMAFNNDVLEKYGKNSTNEDEKEMLVQLAFNYIEEQNSIKISHSNYKILELNCYGDLNECVYKLSKKNIDKNMSDLELAKEALDTINDGGKSLPDSILNKISHLSLNNSDLKHNQINNKKLIQEIVDDDKPVVPKYDEKIIKNKEDSSKSSLEIKIYLSNIESIKECDLKIDKNVIVLNSNKKFYKQLNIPLEHLNDVYRVRTDEIDAKFVRNKSILKIKIPLNTK